VKIHIEDTFDLSVWSIMDSFFAKHYKSNYILRNRKLFEWQFGCKEKTDQATVLSAFSDNELIGILGYMPLNFLWEDFDKPVRGAWLGNWMVADSMRNGAGTMLMRRIQELFPIVLAQGAGQMNVPIVSKMGFDFYKIIPRFGVIFDVKQTLSLLSTDTSSEYDVCLERLARYPIPKDNQTEVLSIASTEELKEYSPNWHFYEGLNFGTLRDANYLTWRYLNHPIFDYYILMSAPSKNNPKKKKEWLPAVCVYRIEQTSGIKSVLVGRILEFFAPSNVEGEKAAQSVLNYVLDEMQNVGCSFCDFFCSAEKINRLVTKIGLHAFPDGMLPLRLNPIQFPSRPQNLEIWVQKNSPHPAKLEEIYITKSDGDQDRPNV
jgi:hypothetical protein